MAKEKEETFSTTDYPSLIFKSNKKTQKSSISLMNNEDIF